MADPLTVEQRIARARQAQGLLDNELLQQVLRDVKANIVEQWDFTTSGDTAVREGLWAAAKGVARVESWLRALVQDGEMAINADKHQQQ